MARRFRGQVPPHGTPPRVRIVEVAMQVTVSVLQNEVEAAATGQGSTEVSGASRVPEAGAVGRVAQQVLDLGTGQPDRLAGFRFESTGFDEGHIR